jgi:hypothetical protein
MATLMTGYAESGITTAKFVRRRASDGAFWNTSGTPAFEAYNASNIAQYGIAGTETGATGIYTATDPSDSTAGDFLFVKAAGSNLVVSDLTNGLRWQDVAGPRPIDWSSVKNPTSTVNLSGTTVGTITTYTGDTPQTGDSFARIGSTGSGLTSLAPASTALSTATWTNTLATNLGTLAGHDPGSTLASTTNITAASGCSLTTSERGSIADKVLGRNLEGGSDGGRTVQQSLYFLRNKWFVDNAGTLTVYLTDDSTVSWTATVSSSSSAQPITGNDPA